MRKGAPPVGAHEGDEAHKVTGLCTFSSQLGKRSGSHDPVEFILSEHAHNLL